MGKSYSKNADEQAIKSLLQDYAAAYNSGDVNRVMPLWAENGIVLAANRAPVVGKKAIKAWKQREHFAKFSYQMKLYSEEIGVGEDWAFQRGRYRVTVTPKSGATPVKDEGKFLQIWQRQSDGSWKVARDMANSNKAPRS